jgi:hypothetical protein
MKIKIKEGNHEHQSQPHQADPPRRRKQGAATPMSHVDLTRVARDGPHGVRLGKTLCQMLFVNAGEAIKFAQSVEPKGATMIEVLPVKIVEDTSTRKVQR